MREMAAEAGVQEPETRRQVGRDVAGSIADESAKGYDLVMVGASESRRGMRGELLEKLVGNASSHVVIVKKRGRTDGPYRRILVPVDGSFLSRVAVEFAIRYAEGVGDSAEVTIALVTDRDRSHQSLPPPSIAPTPHRSGTTVPQGRANSLVLMVDSLAKDGGLEKLSPVFKATKVKTKVVVREPSDGGVNRLPVLAEANSGKYDVVFLGAENRAIHYRLFFGYDNEKLVEESHITVVLIVPKVKGA
jgi:nucleotide-binding universal stress UspA family protein